MPDGSNARRGPRNWYSCARPKRSASLTIIVLTFGMSMPFSMIVVATSTSSSPSMNRCITGSSSDSLHLAVADADARARHQLLERVAHRVDRFDAVVKVVDLPAAIELRRDRSLHDRVARGSDERLDRHAVLRRRLNQREVAHAHQRHVQRARNRRGGERQHVDAGAVLLEPFFVHHAEPLLFVDHDQAEIGEGDVLLQQPVGADHHVHLAFERDREGCASARPWV